jgi:hypothetical protein
MGTRGGPELFKGQLMLLQLDPVGAPTGRVSWTVAVEGGVLESVTETLNG